MRFSTILSAALLLGVAAAAPTNDYSSSSSSSDYSGSSYDSSSKSSSSSSSGCSGSSCDKSSKSSSSGSSYDNGSKSGGCSGSSCGSSSSSSSSMMMGSTSTAMSTMATSSAKATSTSSAMQSSMTYGSGSMNWGGSGYNDCVQKCIASYGAPPASYTPSSSSSSSNDGSYRGSTGTGATHTVIVAPTQGVLRYMPFAVNASVGDTVKFVWGAKNHTVTKSSQLELCNKTSDTPFASGEHNNPFEFTQVVNDTKPTFFYCGTPNHCQKGMFGVINPPANFKGPGAVSSMMPSAVANSSSMAAMMAYTNTLTKGNQGATTWGQNIDLAQLPDWAKPLALENVMYTRAFLGSNPELLQKDGTVKMDGTTPLAIPTDMATVNNAVDSSSSASSAASAASSPAAAPNAASSAAAASTSAPAKGNGAASTAASSALLGVAALAAAVLAF